MFDLTAPCRSCPFRRGVGQMFQLSAGRLEEIRTAPAFECHKTAHNENAAPQQCRGLLSVLAAECTPNQIMQLASRLGEVELDRLHHPDAYDCWARVLEAHGAKEAAQ